MKKRIDKLALIFGAGRDVAEDLDRIVEKFFGYYERGEMEIINPRGGGNAETA